MEWTIICNVNDYNVEGAFNKLPRIDWKQSTGVEVNDIVYIYVGLPVQAISYKCLATKVNLPDADIDDSEFVLDGTNYESYGRYMELELLGKYDDPRLKLPRLKENGFKSVQGPSRVVPELSVYLFSVMESGGTSFDPYLPKGLVPKTRREAISILQRAYDRPVTAREFTDIMYEIGHHQSAVFTELRDMENLGLLERTGTQQQYYFQLKQRQHAPRYFYVFQNHTFAQEAPGQYLWAPKKAKDGSDNHHWSRMQQVRKGDVIFHGFKQHIAAVSIAKADAYSAERPVELPDEWNNDGWRVDSDYYIFPHAIKPMDYWEDLKELQPDKYAPFDKNGNGNTGYLYEMNQKMARFILSATGGSVETPILDGEFEDVVIDYEPEDIEGQILIQGDMSSVIENLIKQYKKELPAIKPEMEELEKLRSDFVNYYNMNRLMNMTKEEYVVGRGSKDSFCYRLENELQGLGNIHGATSAKFGLYYGKSGDDTEEKYRCTKKYGENPDEALEEIKKQIVFLRMDGEKKDLDAIRKSELAPLLRGKILSVFFPDDYLSIFAPEHLDYFMLKLEIPIDVNDDILSKQMKLVDWKNNRSDTREWNNQVFASFLYTMFGRPFEEEKENNDAQNERDKEYPKEYVTNLGITIGQWKELLQDPDVFTAEDIELMKRFYISDNHATTCFDLGIQDGASATSYITPVVNLAKRISKKLELKPILDNDGKRTWWRIPFWGSYRDDNRFEWKLRPKLAKALAALYPELDKTMDSDVEEAADDSLISDLKQAPLNNAGDGFEYKGEAKKKQPPTYSNGHKTYPRDKQTAINALAHAHYVCEIDEKHPTFIRRKSDKNYTEPHHLVPMSESDKISVSLDVEENIVSLCSNCHNQIHYGKGAEALLRQLYDERKDALESVGIIITIEQLLAMYHIH